MTFNKFMNYYALAFLLFTTVILIKHFKRFYIAKRDEHTRLLYLNTKSSIQRLLCTVVISYICAIVIIVINFLTGINSGVYLLLGFIPLLVAYLNIAIIDEDTVSFYFSKKIKISKIQKVEIKENKKGKKVIDVYTSKFDKVTVRGNCEENLVALYTYLSNVTALSAN